MPPDSEQRGNQFALQALAAEQTRNFVVASQLYEQAIHWAPNHADAMHRLGVVHFELGEAHQALRWILRALDLTQWRVPLFRQSLCRVLGAVASIRCAGETESGLSAKGREYRALLANTQAPPRTFSGGGDPALVSVVVPLGKWGGDSRATLESIYAQTYRAIEVVVIDDGSMDGSPGIAQSSLADCPFPHRRVVREDRGAHIALNEAIGITHGRYINTLDPGDLFAPRRIERMIAEVQSRFAHLAFSGVQHVDERGLPIDPFVDARVYASYCSQANIAYCETVGHALLANKVAVTTGNLFFSRELFDKLGGFRNFQHNLEWDFCLRALWHGEPIYVEERLCSQRFFGAGAMAANGVESHAEIVTMYRDYFAKAFDRGQTGSEFTPNLYRWGDRFAVDVLRSGLASVLSPALLKNYAVSLLPT